MTRAKKIVWVLALTVCMFGAFLLSVLGLWKVSAEPVEKTYNKVAFESVEGNCWDSAGMPLTNAIDGDLTNVAAVGNWGVTSFFQAEEAMVFSFAEEKVIDRLVINYFDGIKYTAAWRVEVSLDNENWARIKPNESADAVVYNNEVIQTSSRDDKELVIDFDAVLCKYVRLTMVIKQAWGENCCGGLSEVTAYVSEGAQEKAMQCGKAVTYTAEATSITAGDVSSLNDGKNKAFIGDNSGSLVLWEYATVTFTLAQEKKVSAIRIYPNGWEVGTTTAITDNGDGTYTIDEDAFANKQVASGFLFEGSMNGTDWTPLGEYREVKPYIFAQTFDLNSAENVKYVRMTIKGLSLHPNISAYGEIEIYDSKPMTLPEEDQDTLVLADGDYKTEYLQGEKLDLTGLNVIYTAKDGGPQTIPVTEDMVSGYNAKTIGEQTLTITYNDLTVTYKVKVEYPAATGTKLVFSSGEFVGNQFMSSAAGLFDGNLLECSTLGYWGQTDFYNFFEPLTFTIADSSLKDGKAAVDTVRVYLDAARLQTDVYMVEVSQDKINWATVDYTETDDTVIMNNGVGFAQQGNKSYLDICFDAVYAKYIRLTVLSKSMQSGTCLGCLAEVEAYCNNAENAKDIAGGSLQEYTYKAESVDKSSKENALNNNANLYFGQNNATSSDCLVLFGGKNEEGDLAADAVIDITLSNYIHPSRLMLFPNGYNVLNIKPGTDSADADAKVNKSLPASFRVEGSADGESWVELGLFTDVANYNFAQEFLLNNSFIVKYLRLTVLNINVNSEGFTELAELQVYGNTVENFEYKEVGSIELLSAKQVFMPNDALEVTGMQIKVSSNDGGITTSVVDVTADMVSGFTTETYGEFTATITYQGVTCEYRYVVATIDKIEITSGPDKTIYKVGETPDFTGMSFKVYYSANDVQGTIDITNVAPYATLDTSKANTEAPIVISYFGKSATFNVVVRGIKSVSINSTEYKTSYYVGAKLDVTGLTIEVEYTDGFKETVAVTADMISGFTSAEAVEQLTLTITYEGASTTFNVEIKDIPGVTDTDKDPESTGCGAAYGGVAFSIGSLIAMSAVALLLAKKKKGN